MYWSVRLAMPTHCQFLQHGFVFVIPAKAGIQNDLAAEPREALDSGLRRNDADTLPPPFARRNANLRDAGAGRTQNQPMGAWP